MTANRDIAPDVNRAKRRPSPRVRFQPRGDRVLGLQADELFDELAALEDEQRGNAGDAVALGGGGVAVDVELADDPAAP